MGLHLHAVDGDLNGAGEQGASTKASFEAITNVFEPKEAEVFTEPSSKVENCSEEDAELSWPARRRPGVMSMRASTRRVSHKPWRL